MALRQTLNTLTLALAGILLIPAGLILASWNSLPGDSLYPTKRGLERIALAVLSPNYQAETSLHAKLITRRLEEADATIDKKASSQGLEELRNQLHQAKTQLDQAPNAQVKRQAAQKLVQVLATTNQQLETKKHTLATTLPETRYVIVREREVVREIIREVPVTPTPVPSQPSPTIIADIEDVQTDIQQIITEVNKEPPPLPPSQDSSPGQSAGHRQDDKDRPNPPNQSD